MESFKSGVGALTIANTVVGISTSIYFIKKLNDLNNQIAETSNGITLINNNIQAIAKKVAETDQKTNYLGEGFKELTKNFTKINALKTQLVQGINELHRYKSDSEQRIEILEQYLDIIITALEEKDIRIARPKPKPVSRFGKPHQNVQNGENERKVSFGNNSKRIIKTTNEEIEDDICENEEGQQEEDEDEDEDAMKALKAFRNSKKKN
jgi:septal ring factor EnvC (AmiA/AmiB activator)